MGIRIFILVTVLGITGFAVKKFFFKPKVVTQQEEVVTRELRTVQGLPTARRTGPPLKRKLPGGGEEFISQGADADVSPTGNPDLDRVYWSNPIWAERWEEYRFMYQQAQASNRQPPAPPEDPAIDEERVKKSTPLSSGNPFFATEESNARAAVSPGASQSGAAESSLPTPPPLPEDPAIPMVTFRGTSE